MRCLALANALQDRGAECHFICAQITAGLAERIEAAGHAMSRLENSEVSPALAATAPPPPHADWLGDTMPWQSAWRQDAAACQAAIAADGRVDWLVVDHYALERGWHRTLRPHVRQGIVVVDDLGDRDLDCEILLDQNFRPPGQNPFTERLPSGCTQLKGPGMALLDGSYGQAHKRARPRQSLNHVLVYLGQTQVRHLLPVLTALSPLPLGMDLVVSDSLFQDPALRAHPIWNTPGTSQRRMHGRQPSLLPFMERADLAIGPIGSSTWERMCVGLPTLAVTLAANQEKIAADLHTAGFIDLLGPIDALSARDYTAGLARFAERTYLIELSRRGLGLVDGQGADRLASHLVNWANST